ncbi:branched-chain amino acid ABC transporter ATP-binding protein/permease [Xanthobacter oligotrophicus]|uniref:Branched-chain amino acid ABC transporter ATP-binding protein/permease n=1 Tax=Xanthobacter oligotrophicus TaxID=2607286 RepID=A0ABW6ZZU3_9HYPH
MTQLKRIAGPLARVIGSGWTLALISAALFVAAGYVETGSVQMWCFVVINILLAQSINLLTGIAGQISLGHAGFFAIGAYASALALKAWGIPFVLALGLSTTVAAGVGWLLAIPAGRVREFYLAMMSLAFGLIVYEIAREWREVTGGVMGLRGIPSAQIATLTVFGFTIGTVWYFRILLALLVAVTVMVRNFVRSHFGRAMLAVHVSEIAAGTLGVNQAGTKRFAYAISGGLAGLGGALYAHLVGYLTPESFGLMRSVAILVMSIVGGLGSLAGQVLGATFFTYLPELLQSFLDFQYMVYGLALVVSFALLPKGVAGLLGLQTRYCRSATDAGLAGAEPALADHRQVGVPGRPLLEVESVVMSFAGLRALAGVSLALEAGSVVALVGPNGSGKSTLVNVISGIYRPTAGRVVFEGVDIAGWQSYRIARLGITRTFQDPRNAPNLTVRENIIMGANRLYRSSALAVALDTPAARAEEDHFLSRVEALMAAAELKPYADTEIRVLPYGIQRLAEVTRALASEPKLLMLDEPAAGLSEAESAQLARLVRLARDHGVAVLLIDHHMDFLAELVDEVVVFEAGDEIYRGDMDGMRSHPAVITAYLGIEETEHA